jgi:hypothetical protein
LGGNTMEACDEMAVLLMGGVNAIEVDPEIMATAEEIVARSDVVGLEQFRLELPMKAVLAMDRAKRQP